MTAGRRPLTVTFAFAFALVQAATSLVIGSLLLGLATTQEAVLASGRPPAVAYGIGYLLLGVIIIVVALGARRGSSAARLYLTATMIVTAALALLDLARSGLPDQVAASLVGLVIAVIVVILLWNRRARAFFAAT